MIQAHREIQTPHACLGKHPLRFADLIEEVSKLAADPAEAAAVIDRMLRRRTIRFVRRVDLRSLER